MFFYVSGAFPSHWREVRSPEDLDDKHMFLVTNTIRLGAGDTLVVLLLICALAGELGWFVRVIAVMAPLAVALKIRRLVQRRPWEREPLGSLDQLVDEEGIHAVPDVAARITADLPMGENAELGHKKIVLVGPGAATRGGIAQFNSHLGAVLSGRSDVSLLSFKRLYPRWTGPGRAERGEELSGEKLQSEPILVPWLPWTWFTCARRIQEIEPALVVLQWWHPAFGPCLRYVARKAKLSGARVAFVCHNARPHEAFPLAGLLTRSALAAADRVLTLSEATAQAVRRDLPRVPVRSLANPPYFLLEENEKSQESWRARIGRGSPVILFFGYVRPYKGLEDLFRAMPAVRRKHPDAVLVVAGRFYESVQRYRALAENLGIAPSVRLFPDYVPSGEVKGLLSAADVVALPYHSASQSGVIPQALAAGRRVVATSVGDIPDALAGDGVVVPPERPDALAEGLIRALGSPPPAPRASTEGWDVWQSALLDEASSLEQPISVAPRPSVLRSLLRVAGWAVVAYFIWRVLLDGWRSLQDNRVTFEPLPILAAGALLAASRLVNISGWQALLRGAGSRLPLHLVSRIYATSELVRFLPGGALHLAARYRLAAHLAVPMESIVTTMLLDLGLRVQTGVVVLLLTLPWWPSLPEGSVYWWLLIPVCVIVLHPRVLGFGLRALARLLRRPTDSRLPVTYSAILGAAARYMVGWATTGVAFFLMYTAISDIDSALFLSVTGAYALAWVAGIAIPFAPGGLGVREAVGASLLAGLGAPVPAVAMISLRLLEVAVELTTLPIFLAWDRASSRTRETLQRPHKAASREGTS
jgi:glycosyltransferase involved in cell wall biosynthesis